MAFFIGWMNSDTFAGGQLLGTVLWAAIIVVSLLVHEYGHALTAVACGQTASIELMLFGGVTRHQGKTLTRWQEFLVILNGPLAGVALAALAYILATTKSLSLPPSLLYILTVVWSINVFWTVVNLLPVHPLDGGQLLAVILQGFFGHRGYSAALLISTLSGGAIALLCFASQLLLGGVLFLMFAFESFRSWRYSLQMSDIDHEVSYQKELKRAEKFLEERDFAKAQSLLIQLTTTTGHGVIHDCAIGYLAELYLSQGRYQAAYQLLHPAGEKLSEELWPLFIRAAYGCGDWQAAVVRGDEAYRKSPTAAIALINARCHARLDDVVPAVGWLRCAIRDGADHLEAVLKHPDFDLVRSREPFRTFAQQVQMAKR